MPLTILLWTENHPNRETIVLGVFTSEEKLEAAKADLSSWPLMRDRLPHGFFWEQSALTLDEPVAWAL